MTEIDGIVAAFLRLVKEAHEEYAEKVNSGRYAGEEIIKTDIDVGVTVHLKVVNKTSPIYYADLIEPSADYFLIVDVTNVLETFRLHLDRTRPFPHVNTGYRPENHNPIPAVDRSGRQNNAGMIGSIITGQTFELQEFEGLFRRHVESVG